MKADKWYINHAYEWRDPFTGEKEIKMSSYPIEGEQAARENVRKSNWKYDAEYWDNYRGEYYKAHHFWMSKRATKSYYKQIKK